MKSFRSSVLLLIGVLGLTLICPRPAAAANPFQSIKAGIKRAGTALNPFKRNEVAPPAPPTRPAPRAQVVKSKSAPAAKTVRAEGAGKPKKSSATAKSSTGPTANRKAKRAAGPATVLAASAAAADKSAATPPDESPADKEKEAQETAENGSGAEPPADPVVTAAAAPTAPPQEIPFGTPVMGRKGQVRSPWAIDQGMVDVADIPAGTKVKCPFTGKIFRVP